MIAMDRSGDWPRLRSNDLGGMNLGRWLSCTVLDRRDRIPPERDVLAGAYLPIVERPAFAAVIQEDCPHQVEFCTVVDEDVGDTRSLRRQHRNRWIELDDHVYTPKAHCGLPAQVNAGPGNWFRQQQQPIALGPTRNFDLVEA